MKIEEKSNTINTMAVKAEVTEKHISAYATNAMRPLIIQKAIDGQRRAINLNQVEDSGLTKATLDEWVYNCDALHEAACDYSKAIGTDQEAEAEQEVWDRWRKIIRVGEEDAFHPNMFVRRKDVENLRVLAAESDEIYVDGVGFVPTVKGKNAFRAKIEIRLACRITGNATLQDDDRQVMTDMARAERNIEAAEKVLNGYTRGKDVIPGIAAQIAAAKEELENTTETLKKAGVKDVDKYTKRISGYLKQLEQQKKAAEKKLKENNTLKESLQEKYDSIVNILDSIENVR